MEVSFLILQIDFIAGYGEKYRVASISVFIYIFIYINVAANLDIKLVWILAS